MFKIKLIRFQRVIINKRLVTLGVRGVQSVKLGQGYSLNDSEAFGTPVFKIPFRFILVEAMKKLPACISQIKEGGAIFMNN